MGIKADGVEACSLDLLQYIKPEFGDGNPPVMHFSRPDKETLVIDDDAVMIPLDQVSLAIVV